MTPCRNHPYSDTSTPWTLSLKPLGARDTSKLSSSSENCTLSARPIKSSHYYFLPFLFFLPILLTELLFYTNNKSFTLFPVLLPYAIPQPKAWPLYFTPVSGSDRSFRRSGRAKTALEVVGDHFRFGFWSLARCLVVYPPVRTRIVFSKSKGQRTLGTKD